MLPRSSVPRVVGILAMCFAPIGLFWAFAAMTDAQHAERFARPDFELTIAYQKFFFGLSLVLFLAHVLGGAFLCAYRKVGRHMLTVYAMGALLLIVIDTYMFFTLPGAGPQHDRHGFGAMFRLLTIVIAVPWPIVVLVLVNVRRARDALR